MNILIREATNDDLPLLLNFEQKLIAVERPMDPSLVKDRKINYYDIGAFIKSDDAEVFVALINNEIVGSGYGLIKQQSSKHQHKTFGHVGFIFVLDSHRGKGISKLILNRIFDWFRTKHIVEVKLQVYDKNPSAIKAYEKVGFEKNLIEMLYYLK